MKKLAVIAILTVLFFYAWGLLSSNALITVNGLPFPGLLEMLAGGLGLIIATVALFCAAIVMAVVLTGIGVVILGALALGGFFLLAPAFPFVLPVLIPLLIVWAVCAGVRRNAPTHQGYR